MKQRIKTLFVGGLHAVAHGVENAERIGQKLPAPRLEILKVSPIGAVHFSGYLPLYVAKFQFRYNNRLNADIFGAVIKEC